MAAERGTPDWRAALVLLLLTTLLPELLSGATPAPKMASGAVLIFFFAYGLPILALREIAARTGAGTLGRPIGFRGSPLTHRRPP